MKIIIHKEQFDRLQESLSPKDLKNRFNYMFNLDKNKHPGASSYELYKLIQTFQKYVNAIYRITKKETEFDGVDGINVATVWKEPWGHIIIPGKKVPQAWNYTVRVFPSMNESNGPTSEDEFQKQYENFKKAFEENAKIINLERFASLRQTEKQDIIVNFNFMDIIPKIVKI